MDIKSQVPNISKNFETDTKEIKNNNINEEINELQKGNELNKEIININNKDLEYIKNAIDITQEEAMKLLIKHNGNLQLSIKDYLNSFNMMN